MPFAVICTQSISKVPNSWWDIQVREEKFNKGFLFEVNPEGLGKCLTLCSFDIVILDIGVEIFFKRCNRISGFDFEIGD